MSRVRVIVIAVAVVVVAAIGWFTTHRSASTATATSAEPSGGAAGPAVATARARAGELALTVSAQGRVGPPAGSDAKIAFAVPGVIAALDVRVGESVARGDALAELDRGGLANAVAAARADLASAQASFGEGAVGSSAATTARAKLAVAQAHLDELERGGQGALSDRISAIAAERQSALKVQADWQALERERTLYTGGIAARKDVDAAVQQLASDTADDRAAQAKVAAAGLGYASALRQARADVAQARADLATANAQLGTTSAQVQTAQAKLASAEREYANGVLRSPGDGVVLAILKHPGEAVDSTMPVLDVGPAESGDVTLAVPANEATRVTTGNPVTLAFASDRLTSRGRVIAIVPTIDATTQAATIVVSGVPPNVAIGAAVSATIVVGHARGTLVPASAVVQDPQTGNTVVFLHDAKSKDTPFVARGVTVVASDAAHAVLSSGIRPGDEIATVGAYDLLAPSGG
jgi:multidrug efflux pump subunit AcrA (membrane-fusion protein)